MLEHFSLRGRPRILDAVAVAMLVLGLALGWLASSFQGGSRASALARQTRSLVGSPDLSLLDHIKADIWKRFGARGTVVMIGDSHTDFADWRAMLPQADIVNRGVSGDTTRAVLSRLDTILSVGAATAVVMIGTNDVLRGVPSTEIEANYRALLDALIESGARVVVMSTPLTATASANERVATLNTAIRLYCARRACTFVDLNSRIAPEGRLKPSLTLDGVHLNGAGYALWAEALGPLLRD